MLHSLVYNAVILSRFQKIPNSIKNNIATLFSSAPDCIRPDAVMLATARCSERSLFLPGCSSPQRPCEFFFSAAPAVLSVHHPISRHQSCLGRAAGQAMAELSAEAPLAPSEEWSDFSDVIQQVGDNGNGPTAGSTTSTPRRVNKALDNVKKMEQLSSNMADQYGETGSELASLSTSLEDLVNMFDDQITNCFRDLDQTTEQLAPVQIRNQDDIINESQ